MNNIDFSNFTGEEFQSFCNVLLSFEISKSIKPFNASGKDGGIDAYWDNGEYEGKSGAWRFQAKLHNTPRKQSVSLLKNDIKKDIQSNNVKNEDNLIFITNFSLLPKEVIEIENLAKEELRKVGKENVEFNIWYKDILINFISRYPLILSLFHSKSVQVQLYQDYFRLYRQASITDSFTLGNKFFCRTMELSILKTSLKSDKPIIAVLGIAGIGKTRLCVEFFDSIEEENWIVLTLATKTNIDIDLINKSLHSSKNVILYIEDAHEFSAKTMEELFQLISLKRGNIAKLVLTARNIEIYDTLSILNAPKYCNYILKIPVSNLTLAETKNLFESELGANSFYYKYIDDLTKLSKGHPIMIVNILRAIHERKSIDSIKNNNAVKQYLNTYLDDIVTQNSIYNGTNKSELLKLVNLISLIEPFVLSQEMIHVIAKGEDLSPVVVESFLKYLKEINFISGKNTLSIKPDYFSDILLRDALKITSWLNSKIIEYKDFSENIIKNIACIKDIDEANSNSLIDSYLKEFITTTLEFNKISDVYKNFNILNSIVFYKQEIVEFAIQKFIKKLKEDVGFQNIVKNQIHQGSSLGKDLLASIGNLINAISDVRDEYNSIIFYARFIYETCGYNDIIKQCFGFNSSIINNENYQKQVAVLDLMKDLDCNKEGDFNFSTEVINTLKQLSFHESRLSPLNYNQIQVTNFIISETDQTNVFRLKIIDFLFEQFKSMKNIQNQETFLELLLDMPREIFAVNSDSSKIYDGKKEIERTLEYIKAIVCQEIPLSSKEIVLKTLKWYKRWGIDNKFNKIIDEIQELLSPKTLTEELVNLYNDEDYTTLKYEVYEAMVELKCQTFIEEYSSEEIAHALFEISSNYRESESHTPNISVFLNKLLNCSAKNRAVIDFLWELDYEIVLNTFYNYFSKQYFDINDVAYVRNYVAKALYIDNLQSKQFVLSIFSPYSSEQIKKIEQEELEILKKLINIDSSDLYYYYCRLLPKLLLVDKEYSLEQIAVFVRNFNSRQINQLFMELLDTSYDSYTERIVEIIEIQTIDLNIDHYMEEFIAKIFELSNGKNRIFDYFIKRYLYKKGKLENNEKIYGYNIIPFESGVIKRKNLNESKILFMKFINWFIDQKQELKDIYLFDNILQNFLTITEMDQEYYDFFNKIICEYSKNYIVLFSIMSFIGIIKKKNNLYFDLIKASLNYAIDFNEDEKDRLFLNGYIAILAVGLKSGTAGEPFEVDIKLKNSLESYLSTNKDLNFEVLKVFKNALNDVKNNIERDSTNADEIW